MGPSRPDSKYERGRRALNAMKPLGFSSKQCAAVLRRLLNLYDHKWELIEDENYHVFAEAILDAQVNDNGDPQPELEQEEIDANPAEGGPSTSLAAATRVDSFGPASPTAEQHATITELAISPRADSQTRASSRALGNRRHRQVIDDLQLEDAVFVREPKPEPVDMDCWDVQPGLIVRSPRSATSSSGFPEPPLPHSEKNPKQIPGARNRTLHRSFELFSRCSSTPTMPPPPVSALPDELLEEVFLRLPPDEPECIVRASLASKLWLDILTSPRFRGLYRELHGAPPMLGFVYYPTTYSSEDKLPYFKPTTKFPARIPDDDWGGWRYEPWDCHHGRVLLVDVDGIASEGLAAKFLIWNPLTGSRWDLDGPKARDNEEYQSLWASVLCAVTNCDHHACQEGPFRVVLVTLDKSDVGCVAYANISLPQMGEGSKPYSGLSLTDEWTESSDLDLMGAWTFSGRKSVVLMEDALYFVVKNHDSGMMSILKCDLAANCLSLIDVPPLQTDAHRYGETTLMAIEDGSLGFAHLDMLTLHLWSRQMGFDGVASWKQSRVINLKEILPIHLEESITLVGSVEGNDTIFVTTDIGFYGISLKSLNVKKLWKREMFLYLIPYMSFYNP